MKKRCGNCRFGEKVTDEQKAYALKVQAIQKLLILNKEKAEKIKALPNYEEFSHLPGLGDLTYNNLPVEIQGVDIYRVCMNDKNKKQMGTAFKEGGRDIYKTYYTCEHWEDEND